jgi:Domain of unknown function (DUF4158)
MPGAFLTRDQAHCYARYNTDPTSEDLAEHFHLRTTDLELIDTCRLEHTRLGMAVQIGTLPYLNTFPADPTTVPSVVVKAMDDQLSLRDVGVLRKDRIEPRCRLEVMPDSTSTPVDTRPA